MKKQKGNINYIKKYHNLKIEVLNPQNKYE